MQRQSPPKHRHDGNSPLPLGMDWSPRPRVWAGRETIWPHDPRSGWSYCITIPSWVVLAKSRDSDPTVFYRVQVGIQSPEGITTTRTVLRRFNNFLKLHAALKRAFPQKNFPPAPPKGFFSAKTKAMLEGRRIALEEWMAKVLSNIDLSRSAAVASFLELEAAARSSFQEVNEDTDSHNPLNVVSSLQSHPNSTLTAVTGSSSMTSDYGSDTAYETSEIGTPSVGRDNNSEAGLEDMLFDDDLTNPMDKFVKYGMSNIDEGLSMGQAILEHLEGIPRQKLRAGEIHQAHNNLINGSSSKAPLHAEDMLEHLSGKGHGTTVHHVQKISNESNGDEMYSQRNHDLSNLALPNPNGSSDVDFRSVPEILKMNGTVEALDFELLDDVQMFFPFDQSQKLNRVLATMHRRLVTAKTDMEDLISRLNQEVAVKDYLATKVKDLEVELETSRQKSKENLEQALLVERERITQMQWDMEELRHSSMKMELKLNSQESRRLSLESTAPNNKKKDLLHHELDSANSQYEGLLKQHQELEMKSKSDIKVLVKEIKSLRSSQAELKLQLNQILKEKSEAEEQLHEQGGSYEQMRIHWRNLLYKCKLLHNQLQECKINHVISGKEDNIYTDFLSLANSSDLVASSNRQLELLIAEVQDLAQDVDYSSSISPETKDLGDQTTLLDHELRKMLTDILYDNAMLRKEVNSMMLYFLRINKLLEKDNTTEFPSDTNVQSET